MYSYGDKSKLCETNYTTLANILDTVSFLSIIPMRKDKMEEIIIM